MTDKVNRKFRDIKCPLVLISQEQRSGGTLLSNLFDNHSQCWCHAPELYIGHPHKACWPPIDPNASAQSTYSILREQHIGRYFKEGYSKPGFANAKVHKKSPFHLDPKILRKLFVSKYNSLKSRDTRDILDIYFSCYFTCWVNYKNTQGKKKYVVVFVPRLTKLIQNVNKFFADYPDGHLISVLRDPVTWYVSAKCHSVRYAKSKEAFKMYHKNLKSMLRNKKAYGDKVTIVRFVSLIKHTEPTMKLLSQKLDIDFQYTMLSPTFNGSPEEANSSYTKNRKEIFGDVLKRGQLLSKREKKAVLNELGDLYKQCKSIALNS